ncbi:MAG: hypothetical protein J5994_05515 [Ruminococcus sp.]|nr:hypothetical protein [Ruminococcus sp.]
MNIFDWIIIGVLLLWGYLAARSIKKQRSCGKCCGCSGCCPDRECPDKSVERN